MNNLTEKMWIVYVGTFPPRACGIATFTADLVEHFDMLFDPQEETKVVAMNVEGAEPLLYSDKVIFQISENNSEEYIEVAQKLNAMPHVKLISIQHEFGIFGKDHGRQVLEFLQAVTKPTAVTFHTVLPNPGPEQREVIRSIIDKANRLIVMTQTSKIILETVYGAPIEKIAVIPHGIHSCSFTDGTSAKAELGLSGKKVVSTFGLLNKGKGIEFAIESLPAIVAEYPDTVYAVIGTTHPVVMKREGPVYLNQLREQVARLGLENHVIFYDRYVETSELLKFLEATDIYLSVSQNPDQAVSGTLTYALGMGRPAVSTPFTHAREIIISELGILTQFNDSQSISRGILDLFRDQNRLLSMSRHAYFRTRGMTWANVALSYMREFKKISPELADKEMSLPLVKLDHLRKMTDDFGIFQFAILTDPDHKFGYTIDDNSRALVAACWYADTFPDLDLKPLMEIYFQFLEHASKEDGGFQNYFDVSKGSNSERNNQENLEDANARACWSMAVLIQSSAPEDIKDRARIIFKKQYQNNFHITSPRAMAWHIKAMALWLKTESDEPLKQKLISFADFIIDGFQKNSTPEWQWFESGMTYSNAVIPEGLLNAFKVTGNQAYKDVAKASLDFLIENSFNGDVCVPVGQAGWFKQGGAKHLYDQQPEEVSALVLSLQAMYEATEDAHYLKRKEDAFEWFLGNNTLGQMVYSEMSGGCYDGLGENHINLNQGAESTLSYLLARVVMEKTVE